MVLKADLQRAGNGFVLLAADAVAALLPGLVLAPVRDLTLVLGGPLAETAPALFFVREGPLAVTARALQLALALARPLAATAPHAPVAAAEALLMVGALLSVRWWW